VRSCIICLRYSSMLRAGVSCDCQCNTHPLSSPCRRTSLDPEQASSPRHGPAAPVDIGGASLKRLSSGRPGDELRRLSSGSGRQMQRMSSLPNGAHWKACDALCNANGRVLHACSQLRTFVQQQEWQQLPLLPGVQLC
jgi:hypothetical protein